jgi:putative spermidine/putrescine transport system ATP-binding protein
VRVGGDAGLCPNLFDGEVRELIYLGDHTRMRLAVCGQEDFVVKVAHTGGPPQVRPGDRIPVGFTVEDCRALDRW